MITIITAWNSFKSMNSWYTHTHTHTHIHAQNPVLVIIFSLEKLLPWEDTSTKDFWKKEKNNKLTTIPLIF